MLWNASAINGYVIEASDGPLGTVSDLLFEDVDWTIRWLVVDTGNWLPGRKVLLPLSALGKPNRASGNFPVKLTMQQVKGSPNVDTDQPVSRQIEAHVYDYYGWDPYWGSPLLMSNAITTPFAVPLPLSGSTPRDPANQDDPHLRSIATVSGYRIQATDGEIGHVEDLLVDDAGWRVRYVTVDTKNWWPGEKVLISPRSVRQIDWADRSIHLNINRQKIKDSPPYNPATTVDGSYDEKFLTYYGIRWLAA
jgi:hypothetical protein